MTSIIHGGDLDTALTLAREQGLDPGRKADWIDLSTGINPNAYPLPEVSAAHFYDLPSPGDLKRLTDIACDYYGADEASNVTAVPGTALLIQLLPKLFGTQKVGIVSPTYGDHEKAWRNARADVSLLEAPEPIESGFLVLCQPNNPDGKTHNNLEAVAEAQTENGGYLIVDEAFCDMTPELSAVSLVKDYNVIVLKSVGKFFGLAGLRLGFAVAPKSVATQISQTLGSWPISGPALHVGQRALSDRDWQKDALAGLLNASEQSQVIMRDAGLKIVWFTALFTLVESNEADALFNRFLAHKIYVRRFDYRPDWLRIGLPGNDQEFERLRKALEA